jgi:uncharacterized membrane protein
MTIQIKARDLALGAMLIAIGVLIGLAFNAAPSQAQVGGGSDYVSSGGVIYYCQQRDCARVWFQ